jgi:ribosomal-protein-alanine N-acetyltransferase
MPFQPDLALPERGARLAAPASWRQGLPVLPGSQVVLRELVPGDAPALFAAMSAEDVGRFISPPPATVAGFEKFILWGRHERIAGRYVCFAVTLRGDDTAIGLFQIRTLDTRFEVAEWGFALARPCWGTGIFPEAARLMLQFAFCVLGSVRLEARAALRNGRGNGALRKLGAVQEGVLRRSFFRRGEYLDQALWAILREDWLQAKATWGAGPRVIH